MRFHVDGKFIYIRNGLLEKTFAINIVDGLLLEIKGTMWTVSKYDFIWDDPELMCVVTGGGVEWTKKFIDVLVPHVLAESLLLEDCDE